MAAPMPSESEGSDGPFEAEDMIQAFRLGTPRLTDAADGVLDPAVVARVCEGAWDLDLHFDARWLPGFDEVEQLAVEVTSWSWADALLYDPARRAAVFELRKEQAFAYARFHYPRLKQDGWDASVFKAIDRVSKIWLATEGTYVRLPGWSVRPVLLEYVRYALLDTAAQLDADHIIEGQPFVSLDEVLELGEHGIHRIEALDDADEQLDEATRWHRASVALSEQTEAAVAAARTGAPRHKVELSHRAATRTLERGAQSAEVRLAYDQDAIFCCYTSLREVAPDSWARYPQGAVPTRDVLKKVAAEVRAEGRPDAGWFQSVAGRRADLNKRGRLLHDINDLVRGNLDAVELAR